MHGAQAGLPLPHTESPPCPQKLLSPPQPSASRAEKLPSVTRRAFLYRPQQMPLCPTSSSFQLPGLKKLLSKVENWAEVFPRGPAKMPTQSTVGQARSAGSFKCHPDKTSKLAGAEPQSDLCVGSWRIGRPWETWRADDQPAASREGLRLLPFS